MTDASQAALLSILRSVHQGIEAAMQLLMEPQKTAGADKPRRLYLGDGEPAATSPPEAK